MLEFDYKILQCPITKEELLYLNKEKISEYLFVKDNSRLNKDNIKEGFINKSETYFYPKLMKLFYYYQYMPFILAKMKI